MALPILQIAKLMAQLTVFAPVVTDGADKIRKLLEILRRGDGNSTKQLDAIRQAIELQSAVNKKVDDQLRIVEAVLEHVQKSLKVLVFTSAGAVVVAVIALLIAILK